MTPAAPTDARRCPERNASGIACRNRPRDGGACWRHREVAALHAEVAAWAAWAAREHHVGLSDGEMLIGGLVGVKGDLCDWSRDELGRALDAAVDSLGFAPA